MDMNIINPVLPDDVKKRFCVDLGVPIKIMDEPYFSHFIRLYDNHFGTVTKYKNYSDTVLGYGVSQFSWLYMKAKDNLIEYLQNRPGMIRLSTEDMNKFLVDSHGILSSHIYKDPFDGRYFVSFDMIKGNFTSLRHYDPDIFDGADTYEEFVSRFTDIPWFIQSKRIRQFIFGKVFPKRQPVYEKYLMGKVLEVLLGYPCVSVEDMVFFAKDEFVWDVTNLLTKGSMSVDKIMAIVRDVVNYAVADGIRIRAELFKLNMIRGTSEGFIRRFIDSTEERTKPFDLKGVDAYSYPFVVRKLYNEEVQLWDGVFMLNGRKVCLIDIPQIEFSTL